MSVAPPSQQQARIPFYRDTRIIAVLLQIIFLFVVVGFIWFLYSNMMAGLRRSNLLPNYSFLSQPAGFPISESPIPYDPGRTYGYAFIIGVLNTLRVSVIGVVLATILGVIIGISRLSSNWLLRSVATGYVELVRNIPLLLQLFFWMIMSQAFPRIQDSINLGGLLYLHNRGVTLTWMREGSSFGAWLIWIGIGGLAGVILYIARRIQFVRRDRPGVALPWALLLAAGVALVGFIILRISSGTWPLALDIPELQRFSFQGGITITTNFAALIMGLVIYTAVYIGEIVRSGIQAVNKGQREAARALGLTPGQTLRLVIFPQALRIMIPPMTSQYLNLTKNSSLAVAIGFPDLFSVAGTTLNQTGQTVPVMLIVMLSYLSVSLVTSLLMNWYNKRIQLVER
ncbi:polar amino acid ABC transporter, inner membrane subunit [Oscillochloris trichoides DG-6]|uniref:Polar amino acid ABC transporter, inner membrane subunit n=1 Tax=Oscillochloris trichoides DG-6 TaxID=765420 RepID=E1IEA3_9CHLR|nr:ABC transporter permease subunit [Oscillochloris trichoides]EFO80429.1 polar amino acid ABC transporter, inner membrane subunit [Oscillochloris trichoides DG-6]